MLVKTTLYKAFIRPSAVRALWFSLSIDALLTCMVLGGIIFAVLQDIWYLFIFPILFAIAVAMEHKEPRQFRLLRLWLQLFMNGSIVSRMHWGASTRAPLPPYSGLDAKRRKIVL